MPLHNWFRTLFAARRAARQSRGDPVDADSSIDREIATYRRVIRHVHCILYEATIEAQSGWEADREGAHNLFVTTVEVPDEAAAQRVLPLDVPPGQTYWSAWKASRDPRDVAGMAKIRARALIENASGYSCEFRCTDRDGKVRWLLEDVTLERQSSGSSSAASWRAFGVVTDVTESKRVDASLRESEQRFISFMDNFPGPAFIKDQAGRMIFLNRAGRALSPAAMRDDWHGKTARDLFSPDVAALLEAHDQQILESRQPLQALEPIPGEDGTVREYLVHKFSYPAADGGILIGGVSLDVTQQRGTEEELRRQKRLLETLIEASPVGVQFAASQGDWQLFNRKYTDIRPLEPPAARGSSIVKSGEGESAPSLSPSPSPSPERVVETIVSADGRTVVRWSVPVYDDDGLHLGQVTFVQDVTQQERDKQRLRALARELSRADERERRRIATLLHDDIGQLLTSALLELEAMRPDLTPAADGTTQRVAEMLRQTLESTRSLTVQLSPPVLRELGLIPALQWLAGQLLLPRGIQVESHLPEGRLPLDDEASATVFRCVRELFANVVKHSRAKSVLLEAAQEDGRLRVVVEDDGVGFDAARWNAQGEFDNRFGLFNIREQLRNVGGDLEFDSEPGRFTRARLSVPLGQPSGTQHVSAQRPQ